MSANPLPDNPETARNYEAAQIMLAEMAKLWHPITHGGYGFTISVPDAGAPNGKKEVRGVRIGKELALIDATGLIVHLPTGQHIPSTDVLDYVTIDDVSHALDQVKQGELRIMRGRQINLTVKIGRAERLLMALRGEFRCPHCGKLYDEG